jgi:hypothetical protein
MFENCYIRVLTICKQMTTFPAADADNITVNIINIIALVALATF